MTDLSASAKQAVLEITVQNLSDNVRKLSKLIDGNGKPSLDVRLDRIESTLRDIQENYRNNNDSRRRVTERVVSWLVITLLTLGSTAVWAQFFVG